MIRRNDDDDDDGDDDEVTLPIIFQRDEAVHTPVDICNATCNLIVRQIKFYQVKVRQPFRDRAI